MTETEAVMEVDQKPSTEQLNQSQTANLREVSIVLDGWSRTCDTVLNTLNDQINKITKNNGKS